MAKRKHQPNLLRYEHPPVRLNRSRHWRYATTYAQARANVIARGITVQREQVR